MPNNTNNTIDSFEDIQNRILNDLNMVNKNDHYVVLNKYVNILNQLNYSTK